jgi:hypothetical protein
MQTRETGKGLLSSWKKIADYLRVSKRTAQYWERERGLPIKRLPGKKERVWAKPSDLDRWQQSNIQEAGQPSGSSFRRAWAAVAVVALVIVIAGVAYLLLTRKGPPERFHHEFDNLVVTGQRGRELWHRSFPGGFEPAATPEDLLASHEVWFGDPDADGHVELLYTYSPASVKRDGQTFFCFSDSGREKARILFPRTCINRKFDPYCVPHRLAVQGDVIEVAVIERSSSGGLAPLVFGYLNRRLELTDVTVNDVFKAQHRELGAAGELDHPFTAKEEAELHQLRYLKRPGW